MESFSSGWNSTRRSELLLSSPTESTRSSELSPAESTRSGDLPPAGSTRSSELSPAESTRSGDLPPAGSTRSETCFRVSGWDIELASSRSCSCVWERFFYLHLETEFEISIRKQLFMSLLALRRSNNLQRIFKITKKLIKEENIWRCRQ
jgi:hypothetical protein